MLTREEYALQPQDWIQIIIDNCGLNQDVLQCLGMQLARFEEYTIHWYKRQHGLE